MGRSRSATLFLAYLMICKRMTVVQAIDSVKVHRRIIPNWGFLKQLRELDMSLQEKRKGGGGGEGGGRKEQEGSGDSEKASTSD